jgi:hypothetical protein
MNKTDLIKMKLKILLDGSTEHPFPEFLLKLRQIYGLSRTTVCKEILFSPMRMFWLEKGCFKRKVSPEELFLIASYYGIDPHLLQEKHEKFVNSSDLKSQTQYQPKRKRKSWSV